MHASRPFGPLVCGVVAALLVGCGTSKATKDKGEDVKAPTNVTPTPLADGDAQLIGDGGTWSADGVCTPYYASLLSRKTHNRGYAGRDTKVTFTLSEASAATFALYSDPDCKTKVTADVDGKAKTSDKYTTTLAAGLPGVVVYFKAQGVDLASGVKMAGAKLETSSDPIPTFNDLGEAFLSVAGDPSSFAALTGMHVNETPTLEIHGCARLELFGAAGDDRFHVSDKDIPITLTFTTGAHATIYADPACKTAITATSLPKGRISTSLFLKDDEIETVALNIKAALTATNIDENLGTPIGDVAQ